MQAPIEKITVFLSQASSFFDESFENSKKINIKGIEDFKNIMNSKNISRKECLLLPFKTLSRALKL
jgi:nitrogen fixation NifU-like protein